MKQIIDESKWAEAFLDTPFSADPARVRQARRPDDLLDALGVHLKSIEAEKNEAIDDIGDLLDTLSPADAGATQVRATVRTI